MALGKSMLGPNAFFAVKPDVLWSLASLDGFITNGLCVGAPSSVATDANLFEHGCILDQIDSGTGVKAQWENTGSRAVPSWNLLGQAVPGDLNLTDAHILVGNASNVAADVAMSGDVTITNVGATAIGAGKVTEQMVVSPVNRVKNLQRVAKYTLTAPIAQSTVTLVGEELPDNAIVTHAFTNVTTTFTSTTDAATIGLGIDTDDATGIVTAIAINDMSNPWDAGFHDTVPNWAVANFTAQTTAVRAIIATVATEDLLTGSLELYVSYSVSA